jgi:hypothetical protein
MQPVKNCSRCREAKSLTDFHRRGKGLQSVCKTCRAKIDAARKDLCACGQLKSWNRRRCRACSDADVPAPRSDISEAEVAWVAGILEGEGCWTQRSGGYTTWWIAVRMTDLDIIERLQKATGIGSIAPAAPAKTHYKMAWSWQVAARPQREWLTAQVWPWMGVRRRARIEELWPEVRAVVAQQAGHQSSKLA